MRTIFLRLNLSRFHLLFVFIVCILGIFVLFADKFPPSAMWFSLAGFSILLVLRAVANKRWFGYTPLDLPLTFLLLILLFGLWASPNFPVSLLRTLAFVANIAVFWAMAALAGTRWIRWSSWGLLFVGTILGIVFLLGTRFDSTKFSILQPFYDQISNRLHFLGSSSGFNPNLSGGLIALFVIPSLVSIVLGENWLQRVVSLFVAAFLIVIVVLSQSRGALIGIAIALPIVSLLHSRRWLFFWCVCAIAAFVIINRVSFSINVESVLKNTVAFGTSSLQGREELWNRAIQIIHDFPFTGIGLGTTEQIIRSFYPLTLIAPTTEFKHVHNFYLQTAAELGVFALITHIAIFILLLVLLIRQNHHAQPKFLRAIALGLLGSLIVFLVHGFFEVITFAPRAAFVVWALFGLMTAVGLTDQRVVSNSTDS